MKSEFEFIEGLRKKASVGNRRTAAVSVGIGDDCAVLHKDAETDLVITTDLLVEDVDFRLDWTRAEFLGQKALAVSLSDVAAMGAKPVWAMLSIGVPEAIWKTDFIDEFYDNYLRFARKFGVEIIGGDISKTPDKIVFDSIVAGEVKKGKAILRSGAKVGDLIFVTGELGGAAAGLKLLEEGVRYETAKAWQSRLLERQLAPVPQIKKAQRLNEKNLATSMIDLSDGLSSDLAHACRASKVGAKIFAENIPFHKNLRLIAKSFSEKLDYAINGGEDFELLFTVDPKKKFRLKKDLENRSLFCVGEITPNADGIELISNSEITVLQPKGFRHF